MQLQNAALGGLASIARAGESRPLVHGISVRSGTRVGNGTPGAGIRWRTMMPATVWKGHIAFGMVSIPVRLHRAARKEAVRLHHVRLAPAESDVVESEPDRADMAATPPRIERLQQRLVTPEQGRSEAPEERAKAFEHQLDRYVVVREEEIRRLRPKTSPDMQILTCASLAEIDPVFFETSYYVVPDAAGTKPYALLFASLRDAGYVALARMAMHGREHIMVIRPGRRGLLAHTMFYLDEVRAEYEHPADASALPAKEVRLATEFVRALAAPFDPGQFRDEYRAQLRELIESKAKREVVSLDRPSAAAAPVMDIMEALQRSIQAAKKPVRKAEAPVEIRKPRKRRA